MPADSLLRSALVALTATHDLTLGCCLYPKGVFDAAFLTFPSRRTAGHGDFSACEHQGFAPHIALDCYLFGGDKFIPSLSQ